MSDKTTDQQSIFRTGAEDGALFGLYLAVLSVAMAASYAGTWVAALFAVLFVGVPFYCFRRLRRSYVRSGGLLNISALWMQGIVMFACASLIAALAVYVYLRWVDPAYFHNLGDMLMEAASMQGAAEQQQVQMMVDNVLSVVTPVNFVIELILMTIFSGSILSLLMAMIVPLKKVKK